MGAGSLAGMAFRDLFKKRTGNPGTEVITFPGVGVAASAMQSPWASGVEQGLVWSDIFDTEHRPVTRADALRVPAIAAARNRVIEKLAGRPLVDYQGEQRTGKQPGWMSRTDNPLAVSPWHRMAATLDDLIFYGWSLWAVQRGVDGITEALHVPFERWSTASDGTILFDDEPAPVEQVVLIPGPHEGLLNLAPDLIRGGLDLERAWRSRAKNPTPTIILKEREDNGMTLEEAKPYVAGVAKARQNPDGAIMFIPHRIEVEIPPAANVDHLESARNAIRIDVAGYFDATAQGVEASKAQSTLTYETAETAEAQTTDRMAFWSEPIEARLSMDDVVPRGHRVRLDFTNAHLSTTGTPAED